MRALPALAERNGTALLLLHNFHRFLNNPEVVQTTFTQLVAGKQQRTFLVVLSPVVQIPVELEKLFVVLEHALPDREQLERIARELTSDQPDDLPSGDDLQRVLDAAAGLTRYEAEGAFALSLTRHNAIRPESIWELKAQTLKKNNLLTLHRGRETFDDLGGLDNLKDFCRRALQPGKSVKARGVLLLGVPGSGKSCFAKALGNETGRPTLILDLGSLVRFAGRRHRGQRAPGVAHRRRHGPCILFVDEIEKGLSGVGGQGDSGVSTRLFGTMLTWLADHESRRVLHRHRQRHQQAAAGVHPGRTAGRACSSSTCPAAPRSGSSGRCIGSSIGIASEQAQPDDTDWTGAEIRACCRLAALLDVSLEQAAAHVVPVAVTAAESVERLRTWASGRCLAASAPGIYQRRSEPGTRPGRRIHRGPSPN